MEIMDLHSELTIVSVLLILVSLIIVFSGIKRKLSLVFIAWKIIFGFYCRLRANLERNFGENRFILLNGILESFEFFIGT